MMASTDILPRIQQRAAKADQIISQLKAQLQQLKDVSVRSADTSEIQRLATENANLCQEIEQLKHELTAAEIQHGVRQVALPTSKPVSTATSVTTGSEQTVPKPAAMPSSNANSTTNKVEVKERAQQSATSEAKKPRPEKKQVDAKPAAKAASAVAGETADVSRLNMRIGQIVDVQKHPDADSLYVEQVDVGEGKNRTIVSGLVKHVPLEQMQNRIAVFLINLKPAKMRGVTSEGMIMCASSPDKVEIIVPPAGVKIGDHVTVVGYPGVSDDQLNPKKKTWEQIQPDLRITSDGIATYKGATWQVEGLQGVFKAPTMTDSEIR